MIDTKPILSVIDRVLAQIDTAMSQPDDLYLRSMGIYPDYPYPTPDAAPTVPQIVPRLGSGAPCPHCIHGTVNPMGQCTVCGRRGLWGVAKP